MYVLLHVISSMSEEKENHEDDFDQEMDIEVERLLPDRKKVRNSLRRKGYTKISLKTKEDSDDSTLIYKFDGTSPKGEQVFDKIVVMTMSDRVPIGIRVM